jgi:hypothetical protein
MMRKSAAVQGLTLRGVVNRYLRRKFQRQLKHLSSMRQLSAARLPRATPRNAKALEALKLRRPSKGRFAT